jgi:hypothetical protein
MRAKLFNGEKLIRYRVDVDTKGVGDYIDDR